MKAEKLDLVRRIVIECALNLQNQDYNSLAAEAWQDLTDELNRAANMTQEEAEKLFYKEDE